MMKRFSHRDLVTLVLLFDQIVNLFGVFARLLLLFAGQDGVFRLEIFHLLHDLSVKSRMRSA